VGRVLGIIYLNQNPMTLSELSTATGMSKTRMSQVVRQMLELGIVEKVFARGVRQDLYTVNLDYYQTFISLCSETWRRIIRNNRKLEKEISQEITALLKQNDLTSEERQSAEWFLKESSVHLNYFNWLSRLVDFFESDKVFQYFPKK
jgi:DNA-binding transcriptional regulator GbsR (MarR family)